jgi:hypothetical protein
MKIQSTNISCKKFADFIKSLASDTRKCNIKVAYGLVIALGWLDEGLFGRQEFCRKIIGRPTN